MLSFGHVLIRREEFVKMSQRGQRLRLVLDWPASDLPVLLDLHGCRELRFEHLAEGRAGAPARLEGWTAWGSADVDRLTVLLNLRLPPDDEGPPSSP